MGSFYWETLASDSISNKTEVSVPTLNVKDSFVVFWLFLSLTALTSIIAITGNGLVIYAGMRYRNVGRLRYLDGVVKSLALTDLLFALFGPLANYVNYYLTKNLGTNKLVLISILTLNP